MDNGLKRSLPLRYCDECHLEEAEYEDFDNDLAFCKHDCQEKYHKFDIRVVKERPWNNYKVRFYLDHLLTSSLMLKFLFLCEWLWVPDVRQYIMSLVLGDSMTIFQYPNLISSCRSAVYMIGGNGLFSIMATGNSLKEASIDTQAIHITTSADNNARTYLSVIKDNDDHSDLWTNASSFFGAEKKYQKQYGTEDTVDIANNVHTMIIRYHSESNSSTLWGIGRNVSGMMGFEQDEMCDHLTTFHVIPYVENPIFVACGHDHTAIIKKDGTLWVTGANVMRQIGIPNCHQGVGCFTQIITPSKCIAVACSSYSTMYITVEGFLYACGDNNHGQLGLGDRHPMQYERVHGIPLVCRISCGYRHTMIIGNDGTLWATGYNTKGELGFGDTKNRKVFERVSDFTDIISVHCGSEVSFITRKDDSRWGAGSNYGGRLGIGYNETSRQEFTRIPYLPNLRPMHKKSRCEEV